MSNPVGWFEIYVENMERAKAFYEQVFLTKLSRSENPEIEIWAFDGNPQGHGATGALIHMPGFRTGGNSVLVYFSCTDCAVEAERAVKAGGQIQKPKFSIGPHGFIALVIDSEGNMIGLHSTA